MNGPEDAVVGLDYETLGEEIAFDLGGRSLDELRWPLIALVATLHGVVEGLAVTDGADGAQMLRDAAAEVIDIWGGWTALPGGAEAVARMLETLAARVDELVADHGAAMVAVQTRARATARQGGQ